MRPTSAMIFAAGFGTRMRPLTDRQPKPMIEVAGRPLIDHARDMVRGAGIRHVVSNLHYLPEVLEAHLAGSEVETLREEPDILDTGGGLRNALPVLGIGPVVTLNPDVVWQRATNPVSLALEQWDPDRMDALLVCVDPARAIGTQSAGDFLVAPDGQISRGTGAIYGGVQIVKTERLAEISQPVFSLNMLWDLLIAEERCFGCVYPGRWCDVGHPGGIVMAEQILGSDT